MKGYDNWLDKDNPTTNEPELSTKDVQALKTQLRNEVERVIDFYSEDLEADDIIDVLNEFV